MERWKDKYYEEGQTEGNMGADAWTGLRFEQTDR